MSAVAPKYVVGIAKDDSLPIDTRHLILADAWEEFLPGLDVSQLRKQVGRQERMHAYVHTVLSAMGSDHLYHAVARL